MKFKVMAGTHIADGKTYVKGDTVVSGQDLVAKFGSKFVRADSYAQEPVAKATPPPAPNLEPEPEPVHRTSHSQHTTKPSAGPATSDVHESAPKTAASHHKGKGRADRDDWRT